MITELQHNNRRIDCRATFFSRLYSSFLFIANGKQNIQIDDVLIAIKWADELAESPHVNEKSGLVFATLTHLIKIFEKLNETKTLPKNKQYFDVMGNLTLTIKNYTIMIDDAEVLNDVAEIIKNDLYK